MLPEENPKGFSEGGQELLLILEEYWERCPEMRGIPIYQASGLARRGLSVYQTYIEMMNDEIKAAFQVPPPSPLPPHGPGLKTVLRRSGHAQYVCSLCAC